METKSPLSTRRVERGKVAPHKIPLKPHKPRACLDELRRDFLDRCAYCMRRMDDSKTMEVDHFNPNQKKDRIQLYQNLFLSDRRCNGTKSNTWPTKEELARGERFLDCCQEIDYGGTIFEDPQTHELIGTTPAARYHIEHIGLNHPFLVTERSKRTVQLKTMREFEPFRKINPKIEMAYLVVQKSVGKLIPEIPPPPSGSPSN